MRKGYYTLLKDTRINLVRGRDTNPLKGYEDKPSSEEGIQTLLKDTRINLLKDTRINLVRGRDTKPS